jgi:hypothetical protein
MQTSLMHKARRHTYTCLHGGVLHNPTLSLQHTIDSKSNLSLAVLSPCSERNVVIKWPVLPSSSQNNRKSYTISNQSALLFRPTDSSLLDGYLTNLSLSLSLSLSPSLCFRKCHRHWCIATRTSSVGLVILAFPLASYVVESNWHW